MNRGGAAAATWIVRGGDARRCRGRDADIRSRSVATRLRYSRPLEEDETAPEGLDAAPPEVALRTAVAYLLDVHNYSLSRGGGLIGADVPTLDEEVAQLLEDEED